MDINSLYAYYLRFPSIVIDSRESVPNSLFFALKGDNSDGNRYAASALERGCAYAVVDDASVVVDNRYILVDDALKALQDLAAYHRQQLATPIIGITGTNGKTTTKELLGAVLEKKYNTLYTEGNKNNHIGVPLTLLRLTREHRMAVVEMGANHPGEIAELCRIVSPNFGLITNIGLAHLEGFGTIEGVLKTKGALYEAVKAVKGKIFRNIGNPYLASIADGISEISYGLNSDIADIGGHITESTPLVTLAWNSHRFATGAQVIKTHFIGAYNAENMLAAIAVGLYFDVPAEDICAAIAAYEPHNNRSQFLSTERNRLIVDAYNANPSSMEAALDNFAALAMPHKVVVLGDMLELGSESAHLHKTIIEQVERLKFEQVLLVGAEFSALSDAFLAFADVTALKAYLTAHPLDDCDILIKGSRGIGLEALIPNL